MRKNTHLSDEPNFVDIGGENSISMYNNNATAIYPFLLDFGYVGIIIGAFFLASILMISYKKLVRGKLFYTLVFLYVLTGLLYSTMSFYAFYSTTPIISLLVFIYISSGEKQFNK